MAHNVNIKFFIVLEVLLIIVYLLDQISEKMFNFAYQKNQNLLGYENQHENGNPLAGAIGADGCRIDICIGVEHIAH